MTDFEKLHEARQPYTRSQAETMEMYGLHHSVGLLYGAMVFRDKPMTLDEMCQETGMSKTSMSTNVRELARLKLVRKNFRPGVRKDLYEVERNQYQSFIEFFTQIWGRAAELNLKGIADSERRIKKLLEDEALDAEVREVVQMDLTNLQHARQYYQWLQAMTAAFEYGDLPVPIPEHQEEAQT